MGGAGVTEALPNSKILGWVCMRPACSGWVPRAGGSLQKA